MTPPLIHRKTRYEWYMRTSALYEEELAVIDWRKMLPEGGTPGQRLKLLKSLKELLEAMIEYPVTKGRSGLAHSTVLLWCNLLRYLVAWMASEGLWSFSQLGTQHLLMFLKTRRQRHGPGRASATTVHSYVRLYYRMWELRTRYSDSLRVNPGLIEPDVQLLRCADDRPFKAIPEEVALPLIKDAIEWLTRFGPLMTQVAGELWQVRITNVTLPQKARQPRIQALYKEAQWESLLSDLESALQMKTARPNNILCRAMTVTLGAAVIVLLFMVGMRVRELVRLDVDCL